MTCEATKESLLAKLDSYGQTHLLAFWDLLSSAERHQLASQIAELDLPLLDALLQGEQGQPDWEAMARRAKSPKAVRLSERKEGVVRVLGISAEEARQLGDELFQAGKVGVLLVAGGQGSRLGFDSPKSLFPIGPVSSASLLQIHIEKIRAVASRYGTSVPLYLMTSPATHAETIDFLNEHDRFGLAEDDLFVFCQGTMPAVDATTGKLLLADQAHLFLSPDGHGGTVRALGSSGALEHMQSRGIEQVFYLQVDNPLVPIGDAELFGYHLAAKSELTSIAIRKQRPEDKLGVFAEIDGQLQVIEYSDLPEEIAAQRDEEGELSFWAGSIAVHVFDRRFLEASLGAADALPLHVARKKVPYLDSSGQQVEPETNNALKFERFIFDLLPRAERPLVVEYDEASCFAPLKNAPGAEKDTPEYVQQMMLAEHRQWLRAAGAEAADQVDVEISPLFALDAEEVAEQIEAGQEFSESSYLAAKDRLG